MVVNNALKKALFLGEVPLNSQWWMNLVPPIVNQESIFTLENLGNFSIATRGPLYKGPELHLEGWTPFIFSDFKGGPISLHFLGW